MKISKIVHNVDTDMWDVRDSTTKNVVFSNVNAGIALAWADTYYLNFERDTGIRVIPVVSDDFVTTVRLGEIAQRKLRCSQVIPVAVYGVWAIEHRGSVYVFSRIVTDIVPRNSGTTAPVSIGITVSCKLSSGQYNNLKHLVRENFRDDKHKVCRELVYMGRIQLSNLNNSSIRRELMEQDENGIAAISEDNSWGTTCPFDV